jgi:hypothetical protein
LYLGVIGKGPVKSKPHLEPNGPNPMIGSGYKCGIKVLKDARILSQTTHLATNA